MIRLTIFDHEFYHRSDNYNNQRQSWHTLSAGKGILLFSGIVLCATLFLVVVLWQTSTMSWTTSTTMTAQQWEEWSTQPARAAANVRESVVSISYEVDPTLIGDDTDRIFPTEPSSYIGTGIIYKIKENKAYIITNAHVVEEVDVVDVQLSNGTTVQGTVHGLDYVTDLAVVEIQADVVSKLAPIGHSSNLYSGQYVLALGNPLGFIDSLSMGIISNVERIIPVSLNNNDVFDWEQKVIQVDTPINQGNSGGPLFDLNGKIIGINSLKISDYGVEGIAFAIPIDDAIPVIDELIQQGMIQRSYLGIQSKDLSAYLMEKEAAVDGFDDLNLIIPPGLESGIIVLFPISPAEEAGLKSNDIIYRINGKPMETTLDLRKFLYNSTQPGDTISIEFYRQGVPNKVDVTLVSTE